MKRYTAGNLPEPKSGDVDDMLLSPAKNRLTYLWCAFRYFVLSESPLSVRIVLWLLVAATVAMFVLGSLRWGLVLLVTLVLRYWTLVRGLNGEYTSARDIGISPVLTAEGLEFVLECEGPEYVRVVTTPWADVNSISVYSGFMVVDTGAGTDKSIDFMWSDDMERAEATALALWSRALEAGKNGDDVERLEHYTDTEMDEVTEYIEETFGEISYVLHEVISAGVHIDIAVIPAASGRKYLTLCTIGAGAHRMDVPKDMCLESLVPERDELLIYLPADWDLSKKGLDDERNYWPIRLLKDMARLPLQTGSWMMWGHTFSGPDNRPFAPGCPFSGAILICPEPDIYECSRVSLSTVKTVEFLQVFPLTGAELEYERKCASAPDRREPPVTRMLRHFGMDPDRWTPALLSRFAMPPAER